MHHQKFKHPLADEAPGNLDDKHAAAVEDKVEEVAEKPDEVPDDKHEKEIEKPAEPEVADETDASEPPSKKAKVEETTPEGFTDGPVLEIEELDALDGKERIAKVYGVEMPPDFFEFWKFCQGFNRENPLEALVPTCGLKLVGPFALMDSKSWIFSRKSVLKNDLICDHRFYYDPPELQTLLVSVDPKSSFHIGYFRDDPKEMPAFVSGSGGLDSEESVKDGFSSRARIQMLGDNLFGALYNLIQKILLQADPFKQTAIAKLKEQLHVFATVKNQVKEVFTSLRLVLKVEKPSSRKTISLWKSRRPK